MKKFTTLLTMAFIALMSISFTSCDDDYYWHDDYYWYDDYNHGGWGWNQDYWNNGSNSSQNNYLLSEAQTLIGDWRGSVLLSELAEDGQSRDNYSFNAEMTFYQTGNKVNTLCGDGIEQDYIEETGETQTLKFTWYIDNNGDIYIRYNKSGFTYVMDLGSSQSGFFLGEEKGRDVFYGYMIGTGAAKGDVMYIDLERYDPSGARKKTRSAATDSVAPSFGKATGRAFMPHAIKKLPRR